MRIEPIPYEQRDGKDYARKLDAEAYRNAKSAWERVRIINDVSYLQIGEAAILYNLYVTCFQAGLTYLPALEIGGRFGCSTMTLAQAIKDHDAAMFRRLFSIDPHGLVKTSGHHPGSLPILLANLQAAALEYYVTPILATSQVVAEWWDQSLCLVFIDGAHSTEAVAEDIELFARHVAPGGVLCGHDYMEKPRSVADAVDAWAERHGCEVTVQQSVWSVRM